VSEQRRHLRDQDLGISLMAQLAPNTAKSTVMFSAWQY
jgi:hypothetical protein